MAKLGYTSNDTEYSAPEFQPLPKGDYPAIVTGSEIAPTKTGSGHYVKLSWQVIGGHFEGRIIFTQHNVMNANPDAERIGRGELQGFASAMGIGMFDDTDDLHSKPVIAHVTLEEDKNGKYGPKNNIRRASPYKTGAAAPSPEKRFVDQNRRQTPISEDGIPDFTSAVGRAAAAGAAHASAKAAGATNGSRPNNNGSSLSGRNANPFA